MTERRLRRAARGDLDAAVAWYDDQVEGLSADLLAEVEHVIGRISANPQQFPIVHRQIRRALPKQFPYAVYFVMEPSTITVLAVVHRGASPRLARAALALRLFHSLGRCVCFDQCHAARHDSRGL